ncbi:hypothetical protein NLJ89_g5138 [Agrocybe chaxingu]|uniref:Uncharacterized protein n=1 Tax=Agrocybe chaxingu TaxID=84603 RepID=A0A9W8K1V0_9AGAR|nr:hypothetical protein NLJ89_g5138 [Agrocybe chaxingu]
MVGTASDIVQAELQQNARYSPGTQVFFFNGTGDVEYATIQRSTRLPDGTKLLTLKIRGSQRTATLPAAGVTPVMF